MQLRSRTFTALHLALVAVSLVLLTVGCGGGTPAPSTPTDTTVAVEDTSADALAEVATSDVLAGPEVAADAASAACPAGQSCACTADAECGSGRCVETAAGLRCALPCAGGCAAGTVCKTSGDVSWCAPVGVRQCAPCIAKSQCSGPGGADALCVPTGLGGSFCAAACSGNSDCPAGNSCQLLAAAAFASVCVPDAGIESCGCSEWATDSGASTNCTAFVGTTRCTGTRSCGPEGLSACQAAPGLPCKEVNCKTDDDGSPCDDSDVCTAAFCLGGKCVASSNLCECQSDGDCEDDGNLCNGVSICDKTGTFPKCVPNATPPVVCEAATAQCQVRVCDAASGKCIDTPAADGTACVDDKPCTDNSCVGGACKATEQEACVCDSDAFCAFKDDGNLCNGVWYCNKAQDPPICSPKPDSTVLCDDGNLCTNDVCDPASGTCQFLPNAVPCDDGNLCTKDDACANGSCGGQAVDCEDGWTDSTHACDPPTGCTQTWNEICDGIDNDGDGATDNVVCGSGPCVCAPNGTATCPADCVTCPDSGDLAIPIKNGFKQPVMNKVVCAHDYPAWGIKPDNSDSIVDNGDGTITDEFTGLQWSPVVDGPYLFKNWYAAVSSCDEWLAGGHDDWRLPTISELETLSTPSSAGTQPFVSNFIPKSADKIWSATRAEADFVWYGAYAETGDFGAVSGMGKVYCVRATKLGSVKPSVGRWGIAEASATVTDHKTGLMWQRYNSTNALSQSEALAFCNELSHGGHEDWRLPVARELRSLATRGLVDYGRWDEVAFGPVPKYGDATRFWSSTPGYKSDDKDTFWTAQFWYYESRAMPEIKGLNRQARCVRDVTAP